MAHFNVGDKVTVNGQSMTIRSWPADDEGPFVAVYQIPDGRGGFSECIGTYWTGATNVEVGEDYATPDLTLLEAGDGVEHSTAGELPPLEVPTEGTPDEVGYEDHAAGVHDPDADTSAAPVDESADVEPAVPAADPE